jgi:hypothetical protein
MIKNILPFAAIFWLVSQECDLHAEPGSASTKASKLDFQNEVRPILANHCFACHGQDEKTRKGNLRLDSSEYSRKPGKSGEIAIVPGKPEKSELITRIHSSDPESVMPPPKSIKTLKPEEKAILKRWIEEGANDQQHWAFIKPKLPAIPSVSNPTWIANSIDAFILSKLDQVKLKPSPEADRSTLIRRVSVDLRGVVPTLEEVNRYLEDQSSNAYEKMVDRMLASPEFGEKMAQIWLDLARFGDTSGYHYDSTRQMWLWRDYVINSFNHNKRFDQFTIEQLAGDLLPNPTVEQKIASGFNRNSRFNEEGGADPEEFVVRYSVDRTNTLGQVWLGMTLGCAECHTHKYDPISHKEYYQLYAFFTGIKEPMASGNHGQSLPPLIKVPTQAQLDRIAQTKAKMSDLEAQVARALKENPYVEPKNLDSMKVDPIETIWMDDSTPEGASPQGDGKTWQFVEAPNPVKSGKRALKRSQAGLSQDFFTGAAKPLKIQSKADRLFAHVYLDPKNPPKSIMLQFNDGNWEHRAYWGEDKCYLAGQGSAANHFNMGALPKLGEWVRLEIEPEKVGLKPGSQLNGWAFTQFDGTAFWDSAGIKSLPDDQRPLRSLALWEKEAKKDAKLPGDIKNLLNIEVAKRTPEQKKTIESYYVRNVFADTRKIFDPLNRDLLSNEQQLKATEEAIPSSLVCEEMEKPRDAFVLLRGDFLQRGEKVTADVPAIFPKLPAGEKPTRLALAKWLTSADHPLTSRVAVNRFWTQMFGTGLVKTMGDFGSQGETPSHPELLDWLAIEFMRNGWDVKAILKTIAMSSTYRQSARIVGKLPDVDPNNRLLYRAPRFRMSAEEIRDNSLRIAGLLSNKVGGPSVMPYQPKEFYVGKNEGWKWETAKGEDLYRRGIYTFWRRTSLHPMFALFDAPSREECSAMRSRTNTPLQALVTLNDPTFMEAARVFAQRILTESRAEPAYRIEKAFQIALSRKPTDREVELLSKRLLHLQEKYRTDTKAASELIKTGTYPVATNLDPVELASWTGIANLILNLDETMTRE